MMIGPSKSAYRRRFQGTVGATVETLVNDLQERIVAGNNALVVSDMIPLAVSLQHPLNQLGNLLAAVGRSVEELFYQNQEELARTE